MSATRMALAAIMLLLTANTAVATPEQGRAAAAPQVKPKQEAQQFPSEEPAYTPPTYYKGKYYPNEYQGSIGYHSTKNVSEYSPAHNQPYYYYYY